MHWNVGLECCEYIFYSEKSFPSWSWSFHQWDYLAPSAVPPLVWRLHSHSLANAAPYPARFFPTLFCYRQSVFSRTQRLGWELVYRRVISKRSWERPCWREGRKNPVLPRGEVGLPRSLHGDLTRGELGSGNGFAPLSLVGEGRPSISAPHANPSLAMGCPGKGAGTCVRRCFLQGCSQESCGCGLAAGTPVAPGG